jgi:hypothetical protein
MKGYDESKKCYKDCLRGDEAVAVAFLKESGGSGPALELGIGSGRIALPLATTGLRVAGIDISPATVAQMRAKSDGESIPVTMGDFADVAVEGAYRLIYVVWNTFFNLPSQDEQVRCFQNVAAHLTKDGAFVIEAYMPSFLYRLLDDQYVKAEGIAIDKVALDLLRHDPVKQKLEESHVSLTAHGITLTPVVQRYAWPCELDLMARLAGLQLAERWGGWGREPFTARSEIHISVYRWRLAGEV